MSKKQIYLLILETSGNQSYIFSTNKLRDVVGASELIYRVGTDFVERAVKEVTGRPFRKDDILKELPVEKEGSPDIEVVIATSGKAVLLVRDSDDHDLKRRFIEAWSRIAVSEAPGVDALAVFSGIPLDLSLPLYDGGEKNESEGSLLNVFRDAHVRFSIAKTRRAAPQSRFQRLPPVASCRYSGYPAEEMFSEGGDPVPLSLLSLAKIEAGRSDEFKRRMESIYPPGKNGIVAQGLNDDMLEECRWLAVVHADGNGLGQIFTNFHEHVDTVKNKIADGRSYIDYYRMFSAELDRICEGAFREAADATVFKERAKIPLVPVVVGGDDLTVILDGTRALSFTKRFLESFRRRTGESEVVSEICEAAGHASRRLGICAGICVAKGHFPFSESYRLAEELLKSAKQVKHAVGPEGTAIDFHILYDSVVTSLREIREKLRIRRPADPEGDVILTAKPFVVAGEGASFKEKYSFWEGLHDWMTFRGAAKAIEASDSDGKKLFPSSQAHSVRDFLFAEETVTQEAEWGHMLSSYGEFASAWRSATGGSALYKKLVDNSDENKERRFAATPFLDALEAVEFLEGGEDA